MKRKIIDELIKWKTQDMGKPILLTGAKGVGKTYLAYDFAKAFFERICYLNFERDPNAADLFLCENDPFTEGINRKLKTYFKLTPEDSTEARILILDEITFSNDAIEALTSCDLASSFRYVICITSNPLRSEVISRLAHLPVYPLEFDEFLRATNNEWYIELIFTHFASNTKIPEIVHKELLALHELYLQIGGMPGMVNEYLNLSSTVNISEQHSFLMGSYHDYILKDNPDSDALKMNQVFDSLVFQLMKENKKFQYKLIRKGTTHSMYKDAIQKLSDYNYIIKCNRIMTEQLQHPARTFQSDEWDKMQDSSSFKLYMPDIGFLYTRIIEEQGTCLGSNHRKALLENYIAGSLQAKNYPFAFWESDSMAKIDFIFLKDNFFIPVELFESENTRSKSLSILKQKCEYPYAIKISSKNFEFSNDVKYVPYYAVFCI